MKKSRNVRSGFLSALMVFMCAFLVSCSSGSDVGGGGEPTGAASISLRISQTTVKSDNSDQTTITATVLDTNNAVMEGVTVTFSATGGQFNSSANVATDANGDAQVTFSAGADASNQVVTITATVDGLNPRQIPVQIVGSTITLSTDITNLEIGGNDTATLTISLRDAGLFPISNAQVTVSVEPGSTGAVTLSLNTGISNIDGELELEVTGTGVGDVTVRVTAVGASGTQPYTVGAIGTVFGITSPTDDPHSLSTNTDLTITVSAPGVANVLFATTLGGWDGGADKVVIKAVLGAVASAVLRSTDAGTANVEVYDAATLLTSDTLMVAISAPSSEATQVSLQANATVVAPSLGGVKNTTTLMATVRNASDDPVGNAPVAFSIENPTGGGETISPVIAYTGDDGIASSTFTSGSSSSDANGVTIRATVLLDPPAVPPVEDTIAIVINEIAGSVVIGYSTQISSINDDTAYKLPMSVQVVDSNGNAVSGAIVSLRLWPIGYLTGTWSKIEPCGPTITGLFPNEDTNRNLTLDAGEDLNGDGELTPENSAGGSVPATVVTDENGVANFNLVYLKAFAVWIVDEITATTLVLGSETQSTVTFGLFYMEDEKCDLFNSPYGF
jgi:hypothetical protein